jgi:hypothetical protein
MGNLFVFRRLKILVQVHFLVKFMLGSSSIELAGSRIELVGSRLLQLVVVCG